MLLMRDPALSSLLSVYYETPLHSLLISVARGLVNKNDEHVVIAVAELLLEFGVDDRQVCLMYCMMCLHKFREAMMDMLDKWG